MGFGTGEDVWALVLGRSYGLWYWGGRMDFDTGEEIWGCGTGEEVWALVLVRR